jgi:hypothetical protein
LEPCCCFLHTQLLLLLQGLLLGLELQLGLTHMWLHLLLLLLQQALLCVMRKEVWQLVTRQPQQLLHLCCICRVALEARLIHACWALWL